MFDAHCHLSWFEDPARVAGEAAAAGLSLLAVTVTPDEWRDARDALAGKRNVTLAIGLHPWWVRDAADADGLCAHVGETRFVGEVGLDASPRHVGTWEAQLAAFRRVCAACAETSDAAAPKVLSIHAVRAAGAVLDVLDETGAAARCRCVLHWFSGSSEELWRAARTGMWFSLGERGLATRRGREYARILPAERLLTETDLPARKGAGSADEVGASLARALTALAEIRAMPVDAARDLVDANARSLLA